MRPATTSFAGFVIRQAKSCARYVSMRTGRRLPNRPPARCAGSHWTARRRASPWKAKRTSRACQYPLKLTIRVRIEGGPECLPSGQQQVDRTRSTAVSALLHGWTLYIAIRAVHTAIPGLRAEHGLATLALVVELARIRRHCFLRPIPTLRAGHRREWLEWLRACRHVAPVCSGVAGYPALVDAAAIALEDVT